MEFIIHKKEGYAAVLRNTDESLKDFETNNTGFVQSLAKEAWDNTMLKNTFYHKIYSPAIDQEYLCIKVDLPVKYLIIKNHNGYTSCLVSIYDAREDVISHEEYLVWKNTHVASWVDGKWVYVPKVDTVILSK